MPEVASEERFDSFPTVFGSLGIVPAFIGPIFPIHGEKSAVAAHEAVAGVVVNLDVVIDSHLG